MLNIVISGTPGTGKSTLVEELRKQSELKDFNFVNVSKFAIENNLVESYDQELETQVIDEENLIEKLRINLEGKERNIIECIEGDLLEDDLVDWLFVCKTDNTILYDRLKARQYNERKLTQNIEAEIFGVIWENAIEHFGESKVTELINNTESDLKRNLSLVLEQVNKLMDSR